MKWLWRIMRVAMSCSIELLDEGTAMRPDDQENNVKNWGQQSFQPEL